MKFENDTLEIDLHNKITRKKNIYLKINNNVIIRRIMISKEMFWYRGYVGGLVNWSAEFVEAMLE